MAGIRNINKDQEQHLQKKFNLQVAADYSGSEDEDLSAADLATQLKAAQAETKKTQKLTAQLQKQLKKKAPAKKQTATVKKVKKGAPKKQKVTPKKKEQKKKKASSKNGQVNYFGVAQREIPSVAIESMPGDLILFHQSLFHYVYNHDPDRRLIQCSWAGYPHSVDRLASCWRNAFYPFSARQYSRFKDHPDPRIRAMCLLPEEAIALRSAAAEANLSAPFPDVDVNGTTWAIEHRARTGQQSWMEVFVERGNVGGEATAKL